ncbi:DUF2218 domain-containing protein [Nioella aestuarii]|uniref:DUF2218 domain-containing protein n=1 Tax=Nioella aestuarii TaxID=1662864 RepID=UPI003D7F5EAC
MPQITGHFDTPHASKYLQQLCKHFGHKREVSFDDTTGRVSFDFATAHLEATRERLTVTLDLSDANDADRGRHVIDKHLERFAFREGFEKMMWA